MKKNFYIIILFSLLFSLFFACKTDVEYETKLKDISGNSLETNNYYKTSQNASIICFYKQNKYGDPELSTFEHDTASDTNQTVPKGTSIAQLALKSFPGFTYYTAAQAGDTLNIYYKRNLVEYDFYSSKTGGKHLYKFSGLYDTSVTNPSFITDSDYYFLCWKDTDGNSLGTKYSSDNKIFYPELLSRSIALGTKGVADTKGDILLDDGSVISYSEFSALTDKTNIINHACAVLVSTDYNSEYASSVFPRKEDNNFFNILESEKTSLFGGKQKILAAVFKNDLRYKNKSWINNQNIYTNYQIDLTNYLDGSVCTNIIKALKTNEDDFTKSENAFSASISYGRNYCSKTAFTEDWYLPSLAEIYALILLINDSNYADIKTYFYDFLSLNTTEIWSSNSTPAGSYEYGLQKAWAVKFKNSYTDFVTSEIERYSATPGNNRIFPFRKIN